MMILCFLQELDIIGEDILSEITDEIENDDKDDGDDDTDPSQSLLTSQKPLHLGTSRLRMNSSGTPNFNLSLSEGIPENSMGLKNSTGYDFTCNCPLPYLQIDIL
ncbi:hypothetical protein AVEN_121617-1 [Araneus ventricosus]|uniref:Uncharacterized protein n=1 Tax=Araneus ventricosus TaxID=182803 RepID=A0A4Y2N2H6_ARAVE|nr:hypothetical protein AVEN_121617-1 [Araneus ventricosus]